MEFSLNVFVFKTDVIIKSFLLNLNEEVVIDNNINEFKAGRFYNNSNLIHFTNQRNYLKIYTTNNIFSAEINGIEQPIKILSSQTNINNLKTKKFMALPRFKVDYANSYATQDQIIKVETKVGEVVEIQKSTDLKQDEYLNKLYSSLNENGNADAILAGAVAEYAVKNQEAVKSLQETLSALASKQDATSEDIMGFYEDTKAGFEAIQGARVITL